MDARLRGKRWGRYNTTYFVWCVLARYECQMRMGGLRHLYKSTNWETEIVFNNEDVANLALSDLTGRLEDMGWQRDYTSVGWRAWIKTQHGSRRMTLTVERNNTKTYISVFTL
jgi:hypothetical protein